MSTVENTPAPCTTIASLLASLRACEGTYLTRANAVRTRTGVHVHLSYGTRTECGCRATGAVSVEGGVSEANICRGCFGPQVTS